MTGLELTEPMVIHEQTITEVKDQIQERLLAGVKSSELRMLAGVVLDESPFPSVFKLEPGDRLFGVLVI